jgi:hypothetical protein
LFSSNFPLIDDNWFHETSSIADSSFNDPSFGVCFAFHCKAYNFTNFIQNVVKYIEKQRTVTRWRYHITRMADRRV